MKKFLGNLKDLISRHKLLFVICLLAFIIVIVLLYIFFSLFIGGTNQYGDRLDGIENVEISKSLKEEIVSFLEEKEEVVDASVRVQGKIIYIHIKYKGDVSLDKAKEIATSSLDKFDKDEKAFYDIGYYLTQDKDNEEDKGFVVTGSKNAKLDSISWIKS